MEQPRLTIQIITETRIAPFVCNDFPLESFNILGRMNDGHVLVNGDDENVKNH